ncbi:MAG TPA: glycine cleavage system protein GcvH, partial [Clostridiales bacterium]|nr:glycine cleavage system protein GcvH [Clostridiales bacterium]
MKLLQELKYVESHEWIRIEENKAYVGITDYAQDQLGDIVYVEIPKVGTVVEAGDQFIVLESVKAASDVYAPVSGTVVEVNDELEDNPALINESAYDAWIVAIDMSM